MTICKWDAASLPHLAIMAAGKAEENVFSLQITLCHLRRLLVICDQEMYRTVEQTHFLRTGDCSAQFILYENAHDVLLNNSRPPIKLHCVSPPSSTILQSYALPIIFAL
jgi:hypothetical protein